MAAALATVGAAVAGWYVSRKVLRPIRTMSQTAERISGGELEARLDAFGDPELEPFQRSFNEMADNVQERIERERRFTSDVSHELRTPLTSMLSSVQIARRRADDPVAVDHALADLEQRSDAFRDLVLDLLEISRIDAGVADLTTEAIDPEQLVRAVLQATDNEAVPVQHTVESPNILHGDKRRIGQVVQNLLENAERYGDGPTAVTIRSVDGQVSIAVDDAGPGVPEHERTFIFNRFSRGQAGLGSSDGSGLGLALAAEHVRLHGGTIGVTRSPSGGARFEVLLPTTPAEDAHL